MMGLSLIISDPEPNRILGGIIMDIQPIGKRSLLIYINSDELMDLPAPPSELKTDDAADILRKALGDSGEDQWRNVYLEIFVGRDSLLLIARAHSGNPHFFMFRDIEDLIGAAELCPNDIISFLSYCEGKYYLIVYPWDSESPPNALFEYGEELPMHPNYTFHLTEHGNILSGPTALDEVRRCFGE